VLIFYVMVFILLSLILYSSCNSFKVSFIL
jgi:hypothetical protein